MNILNNIMNKNSNNDPIALGVNDFSYLSFQLLCVQFKQLGTKEWRWLNLNAPFWRFYMNLEAGVVLYGADKNIEMEPYQCFLIAPDTDFRARCLIPARQFYIHFLLLPPFHHSESGIYVLPNSDERVGIASEVINYMENSITVDKGISLKIASLLSSAVASLQSSVFGEITKKDPRVEKVCSYMTARLSEKVTNSELAGKINMQVNAFSRFFKQKMGVSPHQFMIKKRLELACHLLHDPELPIDEIASRTGFTDRFHFSRIFLREYQQTPVKYRKELCGAIADKSKYKLKIRRT